LDAFAPEDCGAWPDDECHGDHAVAEMAEVEGLHVLEQTRAQRGSVRVEHERASDAAVKHRLRRSERRVAFAITRSAERIAGRSARA
jgi:hypothetical protein